jgi:hypothetical protein
MIRVNQKTRLPVINKKTDACSTSEGADTEQKSNEAQKFEEEICLLLQIFAKSHSFLEILTKVVSYNNSLPYDAFGSVNYQMLCCAVLIAIASQCQIKIFGPLNISPLKCVG